MFFKKLEIFLNKDLNMSNLTDVLAEIYGERTAVYLDEKIGYKNFNKKEFTYTEIAELVNRIGNTLLNNFKIEKGSRIILYKRNEADFLVILFAIMKIGAIAVPLNDLLKDQEVKKIVNDCGAELLITDHKVFKDNIKNKSNFPSIKEWIIAGPVNHDIVSEYLSNGFHLLDNLLNDSSTHLYQKKLGMNDPVAIFYTSGTTGNPKGALMTSQTLLTCQKTSALFLPFKKSDLALTALPQAHIMGFASSLVALLSGLPGYFLNTFNARKVLRIIDQNRISIFIGVPAMYAMMLQRKLDNYDLSSVRIWFSSADVMNVNHIRLLTEKGAFLRIFGKKIMGSLFFNTYGMVELSGTAVIKIILPGTEHIDGSMGRPLPLVMTKIIDQNGKEAPLGHEGELLIKCPGVTPGYFNNSIATKNLFTNGWLRTGDVVRKEKYGKLYFVDREKDVIKAGGYSIFSAEIEDILLCHPKIAACAVIGIPVSISGSQPLAVLTLKDNEAATPEEIYLWCKQNMADYKCPRDIKIIEKNEMTYGPTMKIQKKILKERFKNEFSFKWMDLLLSD